jgi:tetrahydromethanopterin S-methyltransferase subunit C
MKSVITNIHLKVRNECRKERQTSILQASVLCATLATVITSLTLHIRDERTIRLEESFVLWGAFFMIFAGMWFAILTDHEERKIL